VRESPRPRIPVPASKITRLSSVSRTSTQGVLPPYRTVVRPGVGIEPRVPQNRSFMAVVFRQSFPRGGVHPVRLYSINSIVTLPMNTCILAMIGTRAASLVNHPSNEPVRP